MTVSAHVVAHSAALSGKEIFSVGVTAHRFILAEINTHRMLSRSYRSSRAVPVARLLEEVRTNPAMPLYWGANERGMQASGQLSDAKDGLDLATGQTEEQHTGWGGEFTDSSPLERARHAWRAAARSAANSAEYMARCGLHKQTANRVLEPFLYVHGIITATEWDNFFGLRLHTSAQPEFRELADVMWEAMRTSTPKRLEPGQWHLPYFDGEDEEDAGPIMRACMRPGDDGDYDWPKAHDLAIKVSVARCARSSYRSFETGKRSTLEEDLATYAKLNIPGTESYDPTQPIHASPAEHQATPDAHVEQPGYMGPSGWRHPNEWGNFREFRQYRKTLPGEAVAPLPAEYR